MEQRKIDAQVLGEAGLASIGFHKLSWAVNFLLSKLKLSPIKYAATRTVDVVSRIVIDPNPEVENIALVNEINVACI